MVFSLKELRLEDFVDAGMPALSSGIDGVPYVMASYVRSSSTPDERRAAKDRLVCALLDRCNGAVSHNGNLRWETRSFNEEIRLGADTLGRPVLFLGNRRGPAVSFTHLGLKTWAAMAMGNCTVGIDAACGNEFRGEYPFDRVFADGEFDAAIMSLDDHVFDAAAALWSAKEATVKALGCGFWHVKPLEIEVSQWSGSASRFTMKVRLSGRAAQRFPFVELHPLRVCTFREDGVSVSVAVVAASQ